MILKNKILTIILCLGTFAAKAEGYRIAVQWEGLKDSSLFLAHYYDTKIYVNDTIQLDKQGKGTFSGKEKLKEGLYVLYLNEKIYFDILVGADQEFAISTENSDFISKLKIEKAKESEDFLAYQNFLRKKQQDRNELEKQLKEGDSIAMESAKNQLHDLEKEMLKFMKDEKEKYPGTMYSLFIKTADQIIIPEPQFDKNDPQYDSLAFFYYYNYRRDHFLDNIDFGDDRIINTPLLYPKLDTYFNKILIQAPDSIIPQAMKVINQSRKNKIMFQYTTSFLLNNSVQSKIMGMDEVFLKIADEIYLKGEATWVDSTQRAKIAEEAYLTRYNLIGRIAPELVMENIDGEMESLHQINAQYTVLVFWEPSCGHCKKEIPQLYKEVYEKYIGQNIEFFAVNIDDKKEEWQKFVEEHELIGWHHVWDTKHQSKFRFLYNVKATPLIYLLDKDKKIVAKKLDIPNLVKLIDALLKKK